MSQTQHSRKPFGGAVIAAISLSLLILAVWAALVATLSSLGDSDPAGNGLEQAFAGFEIILVWILLAILLVVAGVQGAMTPPGVASAVVLLPASGVAAAVALGLLADRATAPFVWPIVVPAVVPPVVVAFGFWALMPSLRAAVPARFAVGGAWGIVLLLCVAMWPLSLVRDRAVQQAVDEQARWSAELAAMKADAPLWEWMRFLETRNRLDIDRALERIRALERRQSDAEVMLDREDFPLRYLGSLDVRITQAICDKARGMLMRQVRALVPQTANAQPYSDVADKVAGALSAIQWLVGYGCPCEAEAQAWQTMAAAYRDTNFDVVSLGEYRDPKELGWAVRQDPAQFGMMLPQAPLMAWLNVAEVPALREQALAGAGRVAGRTDQAIVLLRQDAAAMVLRALPVLDLDATPALCGAAMPAVYTTLTSVARPGSDDPRPYGVLLQQMGGDAPLVALQWLASHGCDAGAAVEEAEGLVRAYQDSPQRAAMLANLARLPHRP
ncbi:MAG TPA: hypothetical protein VKQ27_11295 [Acetobacteraceae bacterium]|nr:hypothetical protein [Acetobacteraceae bacterium]